MSEEILEGISTDAVRYVLVESGKGAGWSAEQRVKHGDEWVLQWATAFVPSKFQAREAIANTFGV